MALGHSHAERAMDIAKWTVGAGISADNPVKGADGGTPFKADPEAKATWKLRDMDESVKFTLQKMFLRNKTLHPAPSR